MEPTVKLVTEEIPYKGKGYFVVRHCTAQTLYGVVAQATRTLAEAGATQIYGASTDPEAPLTEGVQEGGLCLTYCHDMLGMERNLGPDRPRPKGQLTLEPLTRATGGLFLEQLNQSFFEVPNASTYTDEDLEQLLTGAYRCGFAWSKGQRVGIYELGFKKELPEIGSIGLTTAAMGQGLGRELLLSVMELLAELGHKGCWLQVSNGNPRAYGLYQSVGFTLDRVLSRWYEVTLRGDLCG